MRYLLYKNQFNHLQSKSTDWFLYDRQLRHERVKPTSFYWFEKQEVDDKFLKMTLTISDKCWHSANLFHFKTYTRGLFRTQSNIDNKAFLWFLERSSSIDVRMSSKCSSAYIYLQLSPIEIICILNIFAVKYIFSDKRRTKYSSSKWITGRFPGLDFILKLNAKYSAHFLPVGATKGFKGNRNSRYDIIRKIVSLEIQANPLMNLWSSSFQAKLHLSVDQELC